MTLNQLYAPPSSTTSYVTDSVPLLATAAALTPPQGHSPQSSNRDVKVNAAMQPMDRIYQMPYAAPPSYSLQYSHPVTSTATTTSSSTPSCTNGGMLFQHPLTKPGPSTSEDYAADPLPFEYTRKYSPAPREDGSASSSYSDSYPSHSMYAPSGPCATPQQQQPSPSPVSSSRGTSTYSHHYAEPSGRGSCYHSHPEMATTVPHPHFRRSTATTQMYNPMPSPMLSNHAFPSLLDPVVGSGTKKEVETYHPHPQSTPVYNTETSRGGSTTGHVSVAINSSVTTNGPAQEAMIKVKTPLKLKYWRNGRRNLQCFPSCKVFGDYSAIKIEDLKQHDFMWGKCRGSLVTEVTLNSNVTFDDLVLLGRVHSLENIPVAFEEAVIRECMLGRTIERDEMEAMKDQWILGERLPDFVQQDAHVACFEFKPKVWKYTEDMAQGKCKRRNVKYYVQFEAFVRMGATAADTGDRRYYACIGSGMSTSFEVGSSRVLARQKRKAATCAAESAAAPSSSLTSSELMQSQQLLALNNSGNSLMHHNVMAGTPHSMYAYQAHHDGQSRSLPPTFPHPQVMMHQMPPSQSEVVHYSMSHQQQQLSYRHHECSSQLSSSQLSVGDKRKMSSERPAFLTDRSAKMLKVMTGVPQSVPI
uniref:Uncharacterized protein n=1 Tax=Hyaloperonospora arabidopsidis (strain Emoy2) TaxID=559515 RepID=M4B226_HYAAE